MNAIEKIIADYKAVYERDPAARTFWGPVEVILTYAGFQALCLHRLAHFLHSCKIPLLPRLIAHVSRFFTGVEIHPGARIGTRVFVDHGMGVVIGETTEIGDDVTLYQGVTLGGTGKEKGKRHPTIGNGVVIGAHATVLGNIRVGNNVRVGAGSVVVSSVDDNCTVVGVPAEVVRIHGARIPAGTLDHGDIPDPLKEVCDRVARLQKELEMLEKEILNKKNNS